MELWIATFNGPSTMVYVPTVDLEIFAQKISAKEN